MTSWDKARELLLDALLLILIGAVLFVTKEAIDALQMWERAALKVVEESLR